MVRLLLTKKEQKESFNKIIKELEDSNFTNEFFDTILEQYVLPEFEEYLSSDNEIWERELELLTKKVIKKLFK